VTRTSRSPSGSDRGGTTSGGAKAGRGLRAAVMVALAALIAVAVTTIVARRAGDATRPGDRSVLQGQSVSAAVSASGRPLPAVPAAAPAAAPPAPFASSSASDDRPPPTSWSAAWKAQLDGIRRSGAMAPEPAAHAQRIFSAWKMVSAHDGVEASEEAECYRAGCFVTLTFADASAAGRFHDHVTTMTSDPSASWRGPRQQLEPLPQPGGKTKITWILLPEPDAPPRP
jgi:hypothetical protein